MAGFKRQLTYVLDFSAYPDLAGLEVRVRPISMEDSLRIASLFDGMDTEDKAQQITTLKELLTEFSTCIVSWNLEFDDTDEVRPHTASHLACLDAALQRALLKGWSEAMSGINDDLGKDSRSIGSYPGVSLPMERLSPAPGSL